MSDFIRNLYIKNGFKMPLIASTIENQNIMNILTNLVNLINYQITSRTEDTKNIIKIYNTLENQYKVESKIIEENLEKMGLSYNVLKDLKYLLIEFFKWW